MHHNPEHFLAGDALGGRLLAHARLLLKLSRRFAAIAPAGLGQAARVVNYKSGKGYPRREWRGRRQAAPDEPTLERRFVERRRRV